MSQTNTRTVSRPAQGVNSVPRKPGKWNPSGDPAPKVVSRGTLSRPAKLGKWSPRVDAANRRPVVRQS
jgi:hypothetical protein